MSIADRIKTKMLDVGLSQRDLAARIGVSQVAIHNLVSGKSSSSRKLVEIADALGCSPEWLLKGIEPISDPDPLYVQIPILDVEVAAGNGRYIDSERIIDWVPVSRDWIQKKGLPKDSLMAVHVVGSSMLPRLHDSDVILINTSDKSPSSGGVYALSVGDELRVKRLIKRIDGAWIISSDNKSDPVNQDEILSEHDMKNVRIIGKAVKVLMGDI